LKPSDLGTILQSDFECSPQEEMAHGGLRKYFTFPSSVVLSKDDQGSGDDAKRLSID
jgi:hypothetical protein